MAQIEHMVVINLYFFQDVKYIERIVVVIKILILDQSIFKIGDSNKPNLFCGSKE